jgi:hypothetical protein
MALYDKEHRAKHYDDFLDKLKDEETESIDDAIDKVKNFQKKGNMQHYLFNTFEPAQSKLYDTFKSKLNGHFGDDVSHGVHGEENEKKVKNALFEALKEYMKIVRPGAVKAIDEIELNEEDALDHLINTYDSMIGYNPQNQDENAPKSIRDLLRPTKEKEGTLGDLLMNAHSKKDDLIHMWRGLSAKYSTYHMNKFDDHQFMRHAYKKVKDHGLYDLTDKSQFINNDRQTFHKLINAINYQDFKDVNLKQYGLEKKDEEQQQGQ